MNLIALLVMALLVGLVVASCRRRAVGVVGFLALIPMYYVLRGTSGQSAFSFVWPYLFMAALTHVFGVMALARSSNPPGLTRVDGRVLAGLYGALALAILIWRQLVALTFTQPVAVAIGQFNDYRVVVFGLLAVALVSAPLATALVRKPQWIRRLTVLDWMMVAFLAYGGFQLLVSLWRTRHLFYSLESFRYYFLMAWAYFVVRFGLESERDARLAVATVVGATVVVAAEFIVEHVLFNNGVSSLQIPWLRAFDALFAGYGRPIPVDGFMMMTRETESAFMPYYGVRGIGLFMHPHTAGFFMMLGIVFVAAWTFDNTRRRWPWLLVALSVLIYGNVLTLSRTSAVLMYAVLIGVPAAAAWALQRQFAWQRLPAYCLVGIVTVYGASTFSPGGELPYYRAGWYLRPIVFSLRAAKDDLLAWNTPASRALPEVVNAKGRTVPATRPLDVAAVSEDAQALASKLDFQVFLIGRGFSPLTRYVIDFFPEAAGYRHVYSTSDVVLLEFFQQFGAIGLGLLLLTFGAFAVVSWRAAQRWSGRPAVGLIALAIPCVVVVTLVGLLHLYPLFRTGVNTSIYGLLGVFGFLHAEHKRTAARRPQTHRPAVRSLVRELAQYADYAIARRVVKGVRSATAEWRRRWSVRPLRLTIAPPRDDRPIALPDRSAFQIQALDEGCVATHPVSWDAHVTEPEEHWRTHRFGWALEGLARAPSRGAALGGLAAIRDWTAHATSRDPLVLDSYSVSERLANWSLLAWTLARHGDATALNDPVIRRSIDAQATRLTQAIEEYGPGYTNNHFLNNLRALFWYGTVWNAPEYRRQATQLAAGALPRLFTASGFLRESSSHYHLLLTRTLIEMQLLAEMAGDTAACELLRPWTERATAAAAFLSAGGRIPLIGDVSPDFPPQWLHGLMTVASRVTGHATIDGPCCPGWHTLWVGHAASRVAPPHAGWHAYPDAGWYRMTHGGADLLWHVNPDGAVGPRSHGHVDLGSFELAWNGRLLVIDPGRPSYAPSRWDARRGASHNTITIDGYDPMLAWGVNSYPTAMDRDYWDPRASFSAEGGCATLRHHGFERLARGLVVERQFTCGDRRLDIVDVVTAARDRVVDSYLHVAPDVTVRQAGPSDLELVTADRILSLRWSCDGGSLDLLTAGSGAGAGGWYSPQYGEQLPTTTIRLRARPSGDYRSHCTISERSV